LREYSQAALHRQEECHDEELQQECEKVAEEKRLAVEVADAQRSVFSQTLTSAEAKFARLEKKYADAKAHVSRLEEECAIANTKASDLEKKCTDLEAAAADEPALFDEIVAELTKLSDKATSEGKADNKGFKELIVAFQAESKQHAINEATRYNVLRGKLAEAVSDISDQIEGLHPKADEELISQ
jgi:uncharacterized protein HemY